MTIDEALAAEPIDVPRVGKFWVVCVIDYKNSYTGEPATITYSEEEYKLLRKFITHCWYLSFYNRMKTLFNVLLTIINCKHISVMYNDHVAVSLDASHACRISVCVMIIVDT